MYSSNFNSCRPINNSNRYIEFIQKWVFLVLQWFFFQTNFIVSVKLQQIQSSASNVNQNSSMSNVTAAGNMRNTTVASNVNGAIMNQGGIQPNLNATGMPFNAGNMSTMINTGNIIDTFVHYLFEFDEENANNI